MNQVTEYYDRDAHVEWERFDRHQTEFAVTMRALREYLPSPPAQILDVGGGPGRYAIALTQQGYAVTLVDLSQESLMRAAQHAQAANVSLAGVQRGNALDLSSFADSVYDAVLLMGPLYHLITHEERCKAIQEAHRVLTPDGILFAAFLTLFSAFRICAERFPEWLFEHQDYADRMLATGVHRGEWGFTTAYHAHPGKVEPLMEENGFSTMQLIGCEGVVAHAEDRINALTGDAWAWWADLNYRLGKDPALHGSATHLLYIGRKEEAKSRLNSQPPTEL